MPLKIRFHLDGEAPADPHKHAIGLRALVLSWIRESDPRLSAKLHDINKLKPYTITAIYREAPQNGRPSCFFELSVLVDELWEYIQEGIGIQGAGIRLGPQIFRIGDIELLHQTSYGELLGSAQITTKEYRFRFLTPTAIHRGSEIRKVIVVPTPECYFNNWLARWNLCCEWPIPYATLMPIVETQVAVTYCKGGTEIARLDTDRNFVGYVGDATFGLLKPETVDPEMRKALAVLAIYSEYCGTGVDTMRGMGETQLLKSR